MNHSNLYMASGNPNVLLMHGAGLGSWIWDGVLPHLKLAAQAIDLPGRGAASAPGDVTLRQCIEYVADMAGPRSVLVGHSISGMIAFGVADLRPQSVAAVVLVGGVVPESGSSFMSLLPVPQRIFLHVLLRFSREGIKLPASLVEREYCSDLDEDATALVLRKTVPEVPRLYLDDLDWSRVPTNMPRYYVKLLNDRSVDPKQQDRIIDRMRATEVETLPTGHLPMLAQPRETAKALNRLM